VGLILQRGKTRISKEKYDEAMHVAHFNAFGEKGREREREARARAQYDRRLAVVGDKERARERERARRQEKQECDARATVGGRREGIRFEAGGSRGGGQGGRGGGDKTVNELSAVEHTLSKMSEGQDSRIRPMLMNSRGVSVCVRVYVYVCVCVCVCVYTLLIHTQVCTLYI